MNGAPLAAALSAEQAFAAKRNAKEQLGLINFNHITTVALPLTTSESAIHNALIKTPKVDTGTYIYDAVAKAEEMLKDAGISSGSIVVLSDGAEHRRHARPRWCGEGGTSGPYPDLHDRPDRPDVQARDAQGTRGSRRRRVRRSECKGPRTALRPAEPADLERVPAAVHVTLEREHPRACEGERERSRHRDHELQDTAAHRFDNGACAILPADRRPHLQLDDHDDPARAAVCRCSRVSRDRPSTAEAQHAPGADGRVRVDPRPAARQGRSEPSQQPRTILRQRTGGLGSRRRSRSPRSRSSRSGSSREPSPQRA